MKYKPFNIYLIILVVSLLFLICIIVYCCKLHKEPFKENINSNLRKKICSIMAIAPSTTTGPRLPVLEENKYILFQLDCGGLNNIRMQYEILTAIAWLSGRNLVLHPKTNWYLLGNTPLFAEDIFDFDCWASQIPVLTSHEWLNKIKKPNESDYYQFFKNLEAGDYGNVHEPKWSPGEN